MFLIFLNFLAIKTLTMKNQNNKTEFQQTGIVFQSIQTTKQLIKCVSTDSQAISLDYILIEKQLMGTKCFATTGTGNKNTPKNYGFKPQNQSQKEYFELSEALRQVALEPDEIFQVWTRISALKEDALEADHILNMQRGIKAFPENAFQPGEIFDEWRIISVLQANILDPGEISKVWSENAALQEDNFDPGQIVNERKQKVDFRGITPFTGQIIKKSNQANEAIRVKNGFQNHFVNFQQTEQNFWQSLAENGFPGKRNALSFVTKTGIQILPRFQIDFFSHQNVEKFKNYKAASCLQIYLRINNKNQAERIEYLSKTGNSLQFNKFEASSQEDPPQLIDGLFMHDLFCKLLTSFYLIWLFLCLPIILQARSRSKTFLINSLQRFCPQKKRRKLKAQNIWKVFKFTAIFAVIFLTGLCSAKCPPDATTPVEKISSISTSGSGVTSFYLAKKLYSLSNVRMSRDNTEGTNIHIYGFEFTYSADSCGNPDIIHMYGTSPVFCSWVSQPIKNEVTKVTAVKFATTGTSLMDLQFTYLDGSVTSVTGCTTCTLGTVIPITGTLIGFAIKQINGQGPYLNALTPDISVWDDTTITTNTSDCLNSVIDHRIIYNMTNKISFAAVNQDITFTDKVATLNGNPTLCGARSYSLSPTKSFLTISGTTMSLSTSSVADVGTFNMTLKVSLASYQGVASITKNFVVTITCEVQTFTFSIAPPVSTIVQVGIDTQPFNIAYTISKTPACINVVSFSMSPSQSFLSLPTPTSSTGGNIEIKGATIANQNTYAEVLTAMVDGKTATTNFNIVIKDPCSTATFQTSPAPLSDMNVNMPSDAVSTQTFIIKTDVQIAHPAIVCPIVVTLTPSASYISITADYQTISVDASQITLTSDLGSNQFTLTVQSANFSGLVAQKNYNFNVIVSCIITSLSPVLPNITVAHNPTATFYSPTIVTPAFSAVPVDQCGQTLNFALYDITSGSQQPVPSWITSLSPDIIIDSQNPNLINSMILKLIATIPTSTYVVGWQTSLNFNLDFLTCGTSVVQNPGLTFANITYGIQEIAILQTFQPFGDSVAAQTGIKNICGLKGYLLTPSYNFITVLPPASGNVYNDLWTIKVQTDDISLVGSYQVTLTASLLNYATSTPSTFPFQIDLQDGCASTVLEPLVLNQMKVLVGNFTDTQSFIQVADSLAIQKNNPKFCGPRTYEFTVQYPFLSIEVPQNPWERGFYTIKLQTNDPKKVGNYNVTFKTSLTNFTKAAPALTNFQVIISMNHPPYFKPKISEVISIQMTNTKLSWSYKLPLIVDDDPGDFVQLTVDLGNAANFAQLGPEKSSIDVSDISSLGLTSIRSGYSQLLFTLDDGKNKNEYKVMLFVIAAPALPSSNQLNEPPKVCEPKLTSPLVSQHYSYLSGQPGIQITWDSFKIQGEGCTQDYQVNIKVKTEWHDHRFPDESNWLQYNKLELNNSKKINSVIVVSEAIYDLSIEAIITVEGRIQGTEKTSSFAVSVTILPAKRQIKENSFKKKARIPTFSISSISASGLLVLEFQDPIMIFDRNNDAFMVNPLKFLELKVLKNPLSQYAEDLSYIDSGQLLSANVTKFQKREIQIQCEFSNSIYISLDPINPDQLKVRVIEPGTFISAIDFRTTLVLDSFSTIQMPRQLSQEMAETALSIEKKQKILVNTISTSSLGLNILLGLSLKYLWGMVNVMQFTIYMNDWKINWPANANLAIQTLRKIALGEFIDTKKIIKSTLAFYGIEMTSNSNQTQVQAFKELSDSLNSVRILQDSTKVQPSIAGVKVRSIAITVTVVIIVLVFLAVIFAVYIFYQSVNWFKMKCIRYFRQVKAAIFWNGIIRFYLQAFLKYSMILGLNLFHPKTNTKKDQAKIGIFILLAIILYVVIPFLIQRTLRKHRFGLCLSVNKKRYGSLYLGVKTEDFPTIFCVFSFLLVRLIFVILTFSSESNPGILVNLFMLLNNFNIIYIGWYQPYDTVAQNNIELFNSFMLQIFSYHLILLANLLETPLQEYNVGWSIITCIGIFFAVNMGYMVWLSLTQLCKILFIRKMKYRCKKSLKQNLEEGEISEESEFSSLVEVQMQKLDDHKPSSQNSAIIQKTKASMHLVEINQSNQIVLKNNSNIKLQFNQQMIKQKIGIKKSLDRISELNENNESILNKISSLNASDCSSEDEETKEQAPIQVSFNGLDSWENVKRFPSEMFNKELRNCASYKIQAIDSSPESDAGKKGNQAILVMSSDSVFVNSASVGELSVLEAENELVSDVIRKYAPNILEPYKNENLILSPRFGSHNNNGNSFKQTESKEIKVQKEQSPYRELSELKLMMKKQKQFKINK